MEKEIINRQKEKRNSIETTETYFGEIKRIKETEKAVLFEYSNLLLKIENVSHHFDIPKSKSIVEREMYEQLKNRKFQAWVPKSVLENNMPPVWWIEREWNRPQVTIKNERVKL